MKKLLSLIAAAKTEAYAYDGYGRLSSLTVSLDGAEVTRTVYEYDRLGRQSATVFGGSAKTRLDYARGTFGELEGMTSPHFSMELARSAPGCRTGAISSARWKASDGLWRSYAYTYDRAGRLAAADYSEDEARPAGNPLWRVALGKNSIDYSAEYGYDLSSNLSSISRRGIRYTKFDYGLKPTYTPGVGIVDDLTLTYDRGRLVSVSDAADNTGVSRGTPDFPDMADEDAEYTYDANGALTSDLNRGLTRITRNRLGLPERVEAGDHSRLEHVYSASGELLRRVSCSYGFVPVLPMSLSATPIPGGALHKEVYDRCGPFEYTDGALSRVLFPGGYISGGVAYNFVHDWQGNVRQVVDGSTGEPVQETHYYPYGMPFAESAVSELRHIKA